MHLGAIDIGSNSIHLVIVRAVAGQHLEIIDREKEMVRLGAGTLRIHRLSRETMDRAIRALRRFKKVAESHEVERCITTATAAVRESHNSAEFIERVRKEVGLDVQVLPGVEEARLIALAVSEVTDFKGRRGLIVDIGGGSTELIITSGGEPEWLFSVRLGAVRLTEKYITTDPISDSEREHLLANLRTDLTRPVAEIKRVGYDFLIGSSGTIVNLVNAAVKASSEDDQAGFESFSQTITIDRLARLNRRLARMTQRERGKIPGLEERRADIVVAGGLLLETIMSEVGAESITSCDWSLREGVILDYLRQHGPATLATPSAAEIPPAPDLTANDVRTRSVLSIARRYDYDAPHSHHVARLALQIFDGTYDLHGLGEEERRLLEYAAILHDIGYYIAHNNHHRHSLYLIKNAEMPGFSGNETAMMAAVARYHRGSFPAKGLDSRARAEHDDFRALDRAQRRTVLRLATILRLADGLDRSNRQVIDRVDTELQGSSVRFVLTPNAECDLEVWSAERKAEWFRKVFDVEVTLEVARQAVEHATAD